MWHCQTKKHFFRFGLLLFPLWWLQIFAFNKIFRFTYKRPSPSHTQYKHVDVESWLSYQIYRRRDEAKCAVSRCQIKAFTKHSQTVKHCSSSELHLIWDQKDCCMYEKSGQHTLVARNKGSRTNGCPYSKSRWDTGCPVIWCCPFLTKQLDPSSVRELPPTGECTTQFAPHQVLSSLPPSTT